MQFTSYVLETLRNIQTIDINNAQNFVYRVHMTESIFASLYPPVPHQVELFANGHPAECGSFPTMAEAFAWVDAKVDEWHEHSPKAVLFITIDGWEAYPKHC